MGVLARKHEFLKLILGADVLGYGSVRYSGLRSVDELGIRCLVDRRVRLSLYFVVTDVVLLSELIVVLLLLEHRRDRLLGQIINGLDERRASLVGHPNRQLRPKSPLGQRFLHRHIGLLLGQSGIASLSVHQTNFTHIIIGNAVLFFQLRQLLRRPIFIKLALMLGTVFA